MGTVIVPVYCVLFDWDYEMAALTLTTLRTRTLTVFVKTWHTRSSIMGPSHVTDFISSLLYQMGCQVDLEFLLNYLKYLFQNSESKAT